ncbi:hypothetical protein GCM10027449_26790 [Sinomonas notoginsengisoli]|uniref:hypothetical protein n=1 Tax=Sinomonas notoginsengisoli TaxID=1457311 RepID=UPI001F240FC6|nr:hypothetical protein [Sinomonas notoginsengisoli]
MKVLPIFAGIVDAGVTPERVGELTRAGIPVDRIAAHKDSADPWADGAPYRAGYKERQALRASQGWITQDEVRPWAYTQDTYRAGKDAK